MNETEQKIFDAAIKVFASEGFGGATTRKIAELAGVNEVTLFRKFQSKENILRTVLIKNRDSVLQTLDSFFLMEKEPDFQMNLRKLGENLMNVMGKRIDLMIILIAEARKKPEVAEIIAPIPRTIIVRLSEFFERQIKQGKMRNVNPKVAALTFISYLFYANLFKGILSNDKLDCSKEEFEGFIDIFTNGIVEFEDKKV
jgi:AcrR family transcriptional regulator